MPVGAAYVLASIAIARAWVPVLGHCWNSEPRPQARGIAARPPARLGTARSGAEPSGRAPSLLGAIHTRRPSELVSVDIAGRTQGTAFFEVKKTTK